MFVLRISTVVAVSIAIAFGVATKVSAIATEKEIVSQKLDDRAAHEPVAIRVESDQPLDALVLCISRQLNGSPVILANSTVIDMRVGGLLGPSSTSYFSVTILDQGVKRLIQSFYRSPVKQKKGQIILRNVAKRCFVREFNSAVLTQSSVVKQIE